MMDGASCFLLTGGYDHTIRLWDGAGSCYRTLQHNDSQVNALEVSPDTVQPSVAVAGHNHIKLYDISHVSSSSIMTFDGHTSNVTDVGFQKDDLFMFSGGEDETVKIWDKRASMDYQVK